MLRLPLVYVDNRTTAVLPFPEEDGTLLFDESEQINMSVISADSTSLSLMERGDALLRLYSTVRDLASDSLYLGGDLCNNCYFVLLTEKPPVFPENFVVKPNLLYVGLLGMEQVLFKNWLRQIANDYTAHTYEKVLQTFIDSAPDMVWFKDINEYHMGLNKAFCDVVGKSYDLCINKQHPEIWDSSPEEYAKDDFICRKTEQAVIAAGKTLEFDESVEKNGDVMQLRTYKTPLKDCYGSLIGTCGIGRDMTRVKLAEHKVSTLLRAIPFPILICDTKFEIQKMNPCADRLLGGYGTTMTNYLVWKDLFLHPDPYAKNTDDTIYTYSRGQEIVYYSVYEQQIIDPAGKHIGHLCFLIDVTYERICQSIMDKAAFYDYLTDTKNRRCFYEDLKGYVGKALSLIYFDLDRFKSMNDLYGHDAGDKVLKDCLQTLKDSFGENHVYRIGGDEFTVIATDVSDLELRRRLENIKDRIRLMGREGAEIDISFGIAKTDALQDVDAFIRESDQMMYRAKGVR